MALMKVALIVGSPAHIFAEWLKYRVLRDEWDGKLDFPTEEGRIVLRAGMLSLESGRTEIWLTDIVPFDEDAGKRERQPPAIDFLVEPLDSERAEVTAECHLPEVTDYFKDLLREIGKRWPEARKGRLAEILGHKSAGRPSLDRKELIYRLVKAQKAEEMKQKWRHLPYTEITKQIAWPYSTDVFYKTRRRLHELEENDPNGFLGEVAKWRESAM